MSKTNSLAIAVPLSLCCLFLTAADPNACTIHIVTDDGDDNGDGEGEGQNGGEGEGSNDGECNADSDCAPGQVCILEADCPPCADPNGGANDPTCAAPCVEKGVCVTQDPPPPGCTSDADCGPGFFCDFNATNGGGSGAPPPNGGGSDRPAPAPGGVCEPLPPPPPGCQDDSQCQPGTHCEVVCGTDPNCPNCDVCVLEGQCVADDQCAALCGPGSQCVISADGSVTCQPIDPPNCTSDTDCNGGTCNAADVCMTDPNCDPTTGQACTTVCWGYCQAPPPSDCNVDSDCPDGQVCALDAQCPPCSSGDPACGQPCFVAGGKCVDPNTPAPPQP